MQHDRRQYKNFHAANGFRPSTSASGKRRSSAKPKPLGPKKKAAIAVYANVALSNIWNCLGNKTELPDFTTLEEEVEALNGDSKELRALENFLWNFRDEAPEKGRNPQKSLRLCRLYIGKLLAIRHAFSHDNGAQDEEIKKVRDFGTTGGEFYDLYTHVGGALPEKARYEARLDARGSFPNIKLFNTFYDANGNKQFKMTTEGIVFFICLALFRDEAETFSAKFSKLRKDRTKDYDEAYALNADSLKSFFTYYSLRRSYRNREELVETKDAALNFAEIIAYLNKDPLFELRDYQPSEDKPERKREKFLPFALRGIEYFNLLPDLRFRRRDFGTERDSEFAYGKKEDEATHDVAYGVSRDRVAFEYVPDAHYEAAPIRIRAIHASMPPREFEKIAWWLFSERSNSAKLKEELKRYFNAYARLLERLLALDDDALAVGLEMEKFRSELEGVFGETLEQLSSDFTKKAEVLLPKPIVGLFIPSKQPTLNVLLRKKLNKEITKTRATLELIKKRTATDKDKIHAVFRLMNYYLRDEEKFRQLPRCDQHRGLEDVEFQDVHRQIGLYGKKDVKNNRYLWDMLERRRPKLEKQLKYLRHCKNLNDLAQKASEAYLKICEGILKDIPKMSEKELNTRCRKFKARRAPQPCTHTDLLKIILGIGENWPGYHLRNGENALPSVEEMPNLADRVASAREFVAPRIPLPVGFTARAFARASANNELEKTMRINSAKYVEKLCPFYDNRELLEWLLKKSKKQNFKLPNGKQLSYTEAEALNRKIKSRLAQDAILFRLAEKYLPKSGFPEGIQIPNVADAFAQEVDLPLKKCGIPNAKIRTPLKNVTRSDFRRVADAVARLAADLTPLKNAKNVFSFNEAFDKYKNARIADDEIRIAAYEPLMEWDRTYKTEKAHLDKNASAEEKKKAEEDFLTRLTEEIGGTVEETKALIEFRNAFFHNKLRLRYDGLPRFMQEQIDKKVAADRKKKEENAQKKNKPPFRRRP